MSKPTEPDEEGNDAPRDDRGDREDRGSRARRPFLLRLPADLHDELRRWADDDLRSLNGQIEFLLRDAVRRRRR